MPEVFSIGLGGGSVVDLKTKPIKIGPISVASGLAEKAICCGGDLLVTTDIAVKSGLISDFGDSAKVQVSDETLSEVLLEVRSMVEDAVDKIKVCCK
jgi:N-methylhydantoinase A/oxoprolinase/acetone carboxylase beta subunit